MSLSYDLPNGRLVYTESQASSHFWDTLWKQEDLKKIITSGRNDLLVPLVTKFFLKPRNNVRILEGGCGRGQYVYALTLAGYDACGVAFAAETVRRVQAAMPELNILYGDVRNLPFPDHYFSGYWSLGVIEHFPDGYKEIAHEMARVIRPGGYLFLTFPQMSPLRRFKASRGMYPLHTASSLNRDHFYQYALNRKTVIQDFKGTGFDLVARKALDGTGGLKREFRSSFLARYIRLLEHSGSLWAKLVRLMLDVFLAPICGHTILLILKRRAL